MAKTPKKNKYPQLTSPKGTLRFPHLNRPDTKHKAQGEYSTSLLLKADDPETQAFLETLTPHYEAALAETEAEYNELKKATRDKLGGFKAHPLFATDYDEHDNPTGYIVFKFAHDSIITPKDKDPWEWFPRFFDAGGNYLKKPPEIWSGTVARINFEHYPWFMPSTGTGGLKTRLSAVQIIDLRTRGMASASSFGFGTEEGFIASDEDEFAEDVNNNNNTNNLTNDDNEDEGSDF